MKRFIANTAMAAALALTLTACGSEIEAENPGVEDRTGDTMADVLSDIGSVSTVASAFESTGLNGVLEGEANYTVLAPTDDAFGSLGATGETLLADEGYGAIVAAALREHMVPGALTPDAISQAITDNGGPVTMTSFGNSELTFAMDGDIITVTNGAGASANLTGETVVASNGAVLTIDTVLLDVSSLDLSPSTPE